VASRVRRLLSSRYLLWGVVFLLYQVARLSRRVRPQPGSGFPRRVVHISPAYFSDESLIGGGERYATSLAEATANHMETTLVSFGVARRRLWHGNLRIEIYPTIKWMGGMQFDPLCYSFLKELVGADVVHCHQYRTVVTNLAILAGAALRRCVFVTDQGGGGCHFTDAIPLSGFVDGFLPISACSAKTLPPVERVQLIYGGVDERFVGGGMDEERERKVLFVGRLLPHKGINYLIEAMDGDVTLEIIGRVYDDDYFSLLQQLAAGKCVRFITDASDEELVKSYRQALATVLPSVYVDVYGAQHPMPELLGLVLLESMACGTPVICTDVGGMPEFVVDGVTGFLVPPNDPAALRDRINYLVNNPDIALSMGQNGRQKVLEEFTWEAVARRCLAAYGE
jgi:glycosyltransferase involved in cell wall biosynthesis